MRIRLTTSSSDRPSLPARLFVTLVATAVVFSGAGCKKKQQIPYPDYSSPKNTAVTFARAMENGDVKVAQEASVAGGMEVDLVEAMTKATCALKQLGTASQAKFGDAGQGILRDAGKLDASESLARGEVVFDGDERATVTPPDGKSPVPVQKVDDDWKVDIGALIRGDDVIHSIPLLNAVASAANEIRPKVEAGKYAKADDVKADLQTRLAQAVNAPLPPTTEPAVPPPASGTP
jgi:hypothetical protein